MLDASRQDQFYADEVFASLDRDHEVTRIGGGFETEVYATDDRRFVVKLKSELGGTLQAAVSHTRVIRAVAEEFRNCLGHRHSISNDYVIARDSVGRAQVLVVQPFLSGARALYNVDYDALAPEERNRIGEQLQDIVWRSLAFYKDTGYMPDLYGMSSASNAERIALNTPRKLPRFLWGLLFDRTILRSQNLLVTDEPGCRVVLVDYDLVRWHWLVRRVYFTVRWLLCWRDHILVRRMRLQ